MPVRHQLLRCEAAVQSSRRLSSPPAECGIGNHKVHVFKDWSDVSHALQEAARREGLISVAPNHRDANLASLAARVGTVCEESHARIQKSIALRQTMKAAAQWGGDIRQRVG